MYFLAMSTTPSTEPCSPTINPVTLPPNDLAAVTAFRVAGTIWLSRCSSNNKVLGVVIVA
jgi:hypothetical protein